MSRASATGTRCSSSPVRPGVSGWVRNRRDGTVEAEVEGTPEQVDEILAWMAEGPPGSRVANAAVTDAAPQGDRGFEVPPDGVTRRSARDAGAQLGEDRRRRTRGRPAPTPAPPTATAGRASPRRAAAARNTPVSQFCAGNGAMRPDVSISRMARFGMPRASLPLIARVRTVSVSARRGDRLPVRLGRRGLAACGGRRCRPARPRRRARRPPRRRGDRPPRPPR